MLLAVFDDRLRSTGADLIRRMAAGDRQAFSDFYDRYAGIAFALVRRIVAESSEAEEVLQEVFWQAWQGAGGYDERRGSPEAWLLNRARSRAIDKLRSLRRREDRHAAPLDERNSPIAAPPGAEAAGDRDAVRSALTILPAPQREVVRLAYFEGMTLSEIALRLEEPLGTVKSRMHLAMQRLRDHFRAGGAGR
jgi:RNA polymerase sigma-70 factor (ECF subfamily)